MQRRHAVRLVNALDDAIHRQIELEWFLVRLRTGTSEDREKAVEKVQDLKDKLIEALIGGSCIEYRLRRPSHSRSERD